MNIINAKNIIKNFTNGDVVTKVLRGVDLEIKEGEWIAIMGKSGAGKSTLMYQLSLLDQPTDGSIHVDNEDILEFNARERSDFRLERLGYVFQDYALVPELTALENVALPALMMGNRQVAFDDAKKTLETVGLGHRIDSVPSQLSGGEQQRVSVARAVAQEPKILFADEPTANLDSVSSQAVIELFKEIHGRGQTIVMVTHEKEYTKYCDRVVYMEDGQIVEQEVFKHKK